jgi:hypothetical protein
MCSSDILKVVHLVDSDIHLVLDDEVEELVGVLFEFLPCRDVIEQRWAENLGVLGSKSPVIHLCVSATQLQKSKNDLRD